MSASSPRTLPPATALLCLAPLAALADTLWRGLALGLVLAVAAWAGRAARAAAGTRPVAATSAALVAVAGVALLAQQLAHAFAYAAWLAAGSALPLVVAGAPATPRDAARGVAALALVGAVRELAGAGSLGGQALGPGGLPLAAAPAAGLLALGLLIALVGRAGRAGTRHP